MAGMTNLASSLALRSGTVLPNRLAKAAMNIRRVFGDDKDQDIEWGIMNGRIYIVQARPYIDKK